MHLGSHWARGAERQVVVKRPCRAVWQSRALTAQPVPFFDFTGQLVPVSRNTGWSRVDRRLRNAPITRRATAIRIHFKQHKICKMSLASGTRVRAGSRQQQAVRMHTPAVRAVRPVRPSRSNVVTANAVVTQPSQAKEVIGPDRRVGALPTHPRYWRKPWAVLGVTMIGNQFILPNALLLGPLRDSRRKRTRGSASVHTLLVLLQRESVTPPTRLPPCTAAIHTCAHAPVVSRSPRWTRSVCMRRLTMSRSTRAPAWWCWAQAGRLRPSSRPCPLTSSEGLGSAAGAGARCMSSSARRGCAEPAGLGMSYPGMAAVEQAGCSAACAVHALLSAARWL